MLTAEGQELSPGALNPAVEITTPDAAGVNAPGYNCRGEPGEFP